MPRSVIGELAPQPVVGPPQVVCVLGMHRSGTSLIARLVNILGVAFGPEAALAQAAPDNPRGFWEHPSFRSVNEAVLARHGLDWDSVDELPDGWQDDAAHDDLRDRAREAIGTFAGAELWGWKDPRTCLTLPFWKPLLPPLRYVLCIRSVIDVARSLERRNGIPIEKGARLWLHYTTAALEQTAGQPTLCVFYEDVLADPQPQAARLSSFLTGDPGRAASCAGAIVDAIDGALQHHHSPLADVARDAAAPDAAKSLYMILRASVPPPALVDRAPDLFETVAAIARDASRQPDPRVVLRDLRAANEQQSRELADRVRELEDRAAEIDELTRRCGEYQDGLAALKAEARALSSAHQEAAATSQALATELHGILTSRAWRWITEYRKMRHWIDRRHPRPHSRRSTRSA